MTDDQYTRILERLITYYADWRSFADKSVPPRIQTSQARAKLDGALEVGFAVVGGHTPFDVEMTLIDITGDLGPRPYNSGTNPDVRKWHDRFLDRLREKFPRT